MREYYQIKLVHKHPGHRDDAVLDKFVRSEDGTWEPADRLYVDRSARDLAVGRRTHDPHPHADIVLEGDERVRDTSPCAARRARESARRHESEEPGISEGIPQWEEALGYRFVWQRQGERCPVCHEPLHYAFREETLTKVLDAYRALGKHKVDVDALVRAQGN